MVRFEGPEYLIDGESEHPEHEMAFDFHREVLVRPWDGKGKPRRYVVCYNPERAAWEAAQRNAIIAAPTTFRNLRKPLAHGHFEATASSPPDAAIRGHLFCSFLALVLHKELQDRLQAAGLHLEWRDIIGDLDRLVETTVDHHGRRFVLCGISVPDRSRRPAARRRSRHQRR